MANKLKLDEAKKHIQAAEKCMKTSFTKWNPDPDGAASEYIKAAVAFKNGQAFPEAKSAYEKAGECQLQCKQLFHSAKSFEQAGFIAKEMKNFDETAKLIERATNMYLENGTPDTAALALLRAAKMIESERADRAVKMYMKAAGIYEREGNSRQAADAIRSAPRLLIRTDKHDEAVTALQREINYNAEGECYEIVNRLVVCMVLLHLYRGDCVAADKAFKHAYVYPAFSGCEEADAVEQLLEAMNQGDETQAATILNSPLFKYLDNDFAKLARDLRENPPDGLFFSGGSSAKNSAAANESEEEYPEGLL